MADVRHASPDAPEGGATLPAAGGRGQIEGFAEEEHDKEFCEVNLEGGGEEERAV